MNCPHCGKEIKQDVVRHWRTHLVVLPGKQVQVESIGNMPAYKKNRFGYLQRVARLENSPVLVVVNEVKE